MNTPIRSKLKATCSPKRIQKLRKWSAFFKLISWILAIAMLNITGGCMNYFKVKKATGSATETLATVKNQDKRVIVHQGNQAWVLHSPEINEEKLTGLAIEKYRYTLKNPIKEIGANRYRANAKYNESYVLNEVHFYVSELNQDTQHKVSIPISAIDKINIYEKDVAATIGSWILGPLAVLGGFFLILLLTSCPFVYTFDGANYQLAGELYSGSISPQLERHDYLKLEGGQDFNDTYQIKVANVLNEIQHTNLTELWVFDHDSNTEIAVDKNGEAYALPQLTNPISAYNTTGISVLDLITTKDDQYYTSTDIVGEWPETDEIVLEFINQKNSKEAKLLVKAKNSFVLDYMMGQFHDQFGDKYHAWQKKQSLAPVNQLKSWSLSQNIPLSLSVERNGLWEFVDYYNVVGPVAMKEDVLSIPLNGTESNPLKVKLEFGNFFWDIDYAAIDFSVDQSIQRQVIQAKSAINEKNECVSSKLLNDDHRYYTQNKAGEYAEILFDLPPKSADNRTIILHSKGWYQILRNPEGKPDREFLETFREPGRFNKFTNEFIQSYTSK